MDQVSLRDYCDEASSLIQSGEFDKAVAITRHILRHYPRHVASYRLLGQALLKVGNHQEAARQFWRVLGADPEDVTSRIGLATVYEATGELDKAVWQMQRAVDLSPGDSNLRGRLQRLNGIRQGQTAEQLEITRAALGRIHARGGLHAKAVQEFKAVLAQEPDRFDVQVALAEVLWRAGQPLEASDTCRLILEKLPNALKPNLILGTMGLDGPQSDEAKSCLSLAQALDPENIFAQSLLGEKSPLVPLTIKIDRLSEVEREEAWLKPPPTPPVEGLPRHRGLEPAMDRMSELYKEEAAPMSDKERADEEFGLPDWLQGVGDDLLKEEDVQATASTPSRPVGGEDETPTWLRSLVARTEEPLAGKEPGALDETPSTEPGDVPDWLRELRPEASEEALPDSGAPGWLADVASGKPLGETQPEGARLDWLSELGTPEAQPVAPEVIGEPVAEADEGRALWERILAEEGIDLTSAGEVRPPGAEEVTAEEWLRSTFDQAAAQPTTVPPKPTAKPPQVEAPAMPVAPVAEEEVEGVEAPQPAPEAAMEEAELPDWLRAEYWPAEEEAKAPAFVGESAPSVLEPIRGIVEEADIPDWLREIAAGEPVTAPEAAKPALPEVGETGLPDWLRDFKEPVETEVTAELLPAEAEPTVGVEAGAQELPDWLLETEAPAAAEVEAKPSETGMPDWLRQVAAGQPVTPTAEVETPAREAAGWLPEVTEPVREEKAEVEAEAGELPDWLREVQEPQPEIELPAEVLPGTTREHLEAEAEVEEEGLPDWLRKPAAETVEGEAEVAAGVPDWLKMLESEEVPLTELAFDKPIELETGEMPEWLGEVMAEEPPLAEGWAEPEAAVLGEAAMPEEGAPDWLRDLREGKKEVAAEPTAEAVEEAPAGALEYPPGEGVGEAQLELPDWLRRLREGVLEEAPPAAVEYRPGLPQEEARAAMEAEAPPVEVPAEPEVVGPEWPTEAVRAEEYLAELEVIEEEVAPAPVEHIEAVEAGLPPVLPPEVKPEPVQIPRPAPPKVKPEPVKAPPPAPPPVERIATRRLEPLRAADLPKDPAVRLEMAHAVLNTGDWPEALAIYGTLVTSTELLDEVIGNLEQGVRAHPDDPAGYQLLGDACMRDGRLQDALRAYRTALAKL